MPAIENAQSTESVPIGKKYRNLGVEGKKRIWLQQQQQREWEREWEGKREREIVRDSRKWERKRKNVFFFNLTFKAFKKVSVFFVTFKWKAKRGFLIFQVLGRFFNLHRIRRFHGSCPVYFPSSPTWPGRHQLKFQLKFQPGFSYRSPWSYHVMDSGRTRTFDLLCSPATSETLLSSVKNSLILLYYFGNVPELTGYRVSEEGGF